MEKSWRDRVEKIKPPFLFTFIVAVIFSVVSLIMTASSFFSFLPSLILYLVYTIAAASLFLTAWSLTVFLKENDWRKKITEVVHKVDFIGKLADDYSYRTVMAAYLSFGVNVILAVSKGIAGWFFSSIWLITLAAYYLLLCISKLLLLTASRRIMKLDDPAEKMNREWRAFRTCGVFLILMTIVLQGFTVLVLKDGNHFSYNEILILAVAMYDFYCLISAVFYMVKNRKKHSPIIVAIKFISLAASLVSMLSLQTAMFASFGAMEDLQGQSLMNLLTGLAVCIILLISGFAMVLQAHKNIKKD